ncbi:MAG: prohibitin family protein [Rickettsiales bacterium TMED289]|nr:MAG: prohibitin family protein [Rickettsiales bacterium TMED289]|tara:strand:- start:838 stop:1665 length:828 start_codon:yes stop_codon:yes gene_type:complete
MQNSKLVSVIVFLLFSLTILFSFASSIFYVIESTERAVIFYKFGDTGLDKKNVVKPGFGVKAPWNDLYRFDITDNLVEETIDVLDGSGLSINVDVTMNFHLDYDSVGEIYETYQFDYLRRLVRPVFRSTVRDVMGRYTAEEIYSTKRAEVENLIQEEASEVLKKPGNNIVMRSLLIRSITLPNQIKSAIENKLQQEQEALAYQYRLEREKSEAERIRIEATGRADANRIINNSLTPNLLRMRGIEATSKLAESPNSKVVVVGSGKDGLPIILGNN